MVQIKKASRQQVKIRLSLASPTGFGKTTSALMIAYGITGNWGKIGVIDTENKSASFYANHSFGNFKVGEFLTIQLEPPYTPESYTEAIRAFENEGVKVVIIDSVTHVWQGQGGLLEFNSSLGSNSFQNWAKTTPRYQKWLDSILQSKCHIITTARKKQEYALVEGANGKKTVEKKGMADQIRDGYDYEMTLAFDIINDQHMAIATKDRTGLFMGAPEFVITDKVGTQVKAWCDSGEKPITTDEAIRMINKAKTIDKLKEIKATLSADVLKDEKFTVAAIEKFNALNNKQPA